MEGSNGILAPPVDTGDSGAIADPLERNHTEASSASPEGGDNVIPELRREVEELNKRSAQRIAVGRAQKEGATGPKARGKGSVTDSGVESALPSPSASRAETDLGESSEDDDPRRTRARTTRKVPRTTSRTATRTKPGDVSAAQPPRSQCRARTTR